MRLTPFVDFFNLFNHDPANVYSGLDSVFGSLNFDYARAPAGQRASDLDTGRQRIAPNGTRKVQIGIRFEW